MAAVFISHIHEENFEADALDWFLRDRLKVESFLASSIWHLRGGEHWLDRIRSELRECQVMLSLLSPRSIGRAWINFEAGGAWAAQKPVIPCCFNGTKKGNLPQPLASLQALELPKDLYELVISVHHHLGRAGIPPPPFFDDDLATAVQEAFRGKGFHPPIPPLPGSQD